LAILSLIARLRGPEDLGLVSIGLAAGGILAIFSDLALGSLLVREASRDPARLDAVFGAALVARVAAVSVLLAASWVVAVLVFGAAAPLIWLPAAGLVMQQFAELTRSVSLARRRFGLMAGHAIFENLAWLGFVGGVLAVSGSLEGALLGGLLAFSISVLGGLILVRLVFHVVPRLPSAADRRQLARDAQPFATFTVLNILYARLDTLLVGALTPVGGIVAAGAYYAATRLIAAFDYLPDAMARSIFPDLASSFATEPARFAVLLRRPARLLLFIGVPVPFGVVVAGNWLMDALYGPVIAQYSWVLLGLAALVPLRFISNLLGLALTSADSQGRRAFAAGCALGAIAVVDILLIPRLGVAGAVVGATVATITLLAIYLASLRRIPGQGVPVAMDAIAPIVAALAATAAGLLVRVAAPAPVAGAVFALVYVLGIASAPLRGLWRNRPL
jgi:O-antigen/teichoic acid export membrane protein